MKVWGFNCYGVCIAYIDKEKIAEYNSRHPLASDYIASWQKAE